MWQLEPLEVCEEELEPEKCFYAGEESTNAGENPVNNSTFRSRSSRKDTIVFQKRGKRSKKATQSSSTQPVGAEPMLKVSRIFLQYPANSHDIVDRFELQNSRESSNSLSLKTYYI